MGRVARYKKVKACDPYSSKNGGRLDADTVGVWGLGESGRKAKKRSRTSQKLRTLRKKNPHGASADFDVAPEQDDFDLADLMGSLKREKNPLDEEDMKHQPYVPPTPATTNKTAKVNAITAAVADPEEKEHAKLLKKVQQQVTTKLTETKFEDRRPGESKRAYNKRVKLETRQIIQKERQMEHNPLKRQKKKEFLNSKKKKQKGGRGAAFDHSDGDDDADEMDERNEPAEGKLLTGEQAVAARARATQVHFGEQAERPPVFHQLPRGAKKQPKGQGSNRDATKTNNSSSGGMKEEEIEAERQAMDLMRRKVQAQYAAIKAKRKQAGDFHL